MNALAWAGTVGIFAVAAALAVLLVRATLNERKHREMAKHLAEQLTLKDEYVATVSHELRTPLTAIKEGIGLVLDGSLGTLNDEQVDFLKTADQSIDRLAELINNILDLAKIEAGRLRLVRHRVGMKSLAESLINGYRMVAGKRRIEIVLDGTPDVFADPNRIMQVLGNFFSNAVKFTQPDGLIRVTAEQVDGQVRVSVADNGSGIAPDDKDKLFRKFSQVGEGQTRLRGTGLGLALCKELIELHNGRVRVESELGKGSVFSFTLPAYTPELALEESFRELKEFASRMHRDTVGLLSIQVDASAGNPGAWDALAATIRSNVQQGDVVLPYEPVGLVILALTDAAGIRAMAGRLSGLASAAPIAFRCGWALSPTDGSDVHTLIARAQQRGTNG